MTTHTRLRVGTVALVLLAVLLLGGSHLCGVALDKNASDPGMRPIGTGVLACTEFWLNRYQTLLAGLLALGAAAISIVSYRRQAMFAQHSIIHGRIEIMRSDVAEFERAISDAGRYDQRIEDLRRAMSSIIDRSGTIGVTDADTILDTAAQRMQNFGTGIRKTVSGRQIDNETRTIAHDLVRACDAAADQMRVVYDAANDFITARDGRRRERPSQVIDADATFDQAVHLRLTVAEATDQIRVVIDPAEHLQRALRDRVTKIESRIHEYETVVERAIEQ